MKYDSGMKQFHDDIIAALRYMLKNDKEITEKFSPNDGSPAPLRDYLKNKYGKSCASHIGNGMRYSCNATKGLELTYDTILNNPGDKNLTLSWSQVSKFIRDNWDEIFNKSEAAEQPSPQISYIDKLREKYPKVNETDDWFDTFYCPSDLLDGDGVNDPAYDKCGYTTDDEACQKCWRERCPPNIFFCENKDFEEEYFKHYPEEEPADPVTESETADASAETSVTVQENTEVQAAFDYSELDGDTAKNLRECETVIRRETAGYFTLIGAKFKEAQELLANHASGTFEKWYAAMGFKRQTVYNLIRRYEFLNSPTIGGRTEAFEALPLTLSYEVSKPDAPKELVEKALDGDITTNAEYLKLKAELEEANKKADFWIEANSKANEENQQLREDRVKAMSRADNAERELSKLQAEIKELESRPVDVAVQHDPELAEELAELREENERLKNGNIKSFIIRLTLDEYDKLLKKVDDDFNLKYIIKHAKLLKL